MILKYVETLEELMLLNRHQDADVIVVGKWSRLKEAVKTIA